MLDLQLGRIVGFSLGLVGVAVLMPSGPFRRPHRYFWKVVSSILFVYTLLCAALLSLQDVRQAHQTMASYFEGCGQPVPEKFYAEDCRIYTPNHTDGDFQNLLDKLDFYIPAHFIGWMVKNDYCCAGALNVLHTLALILRDHVMLLTNSVGFELLEYTLEPQLPNFGECWWDHWVLDALLCNGVGIWLGMKLVAHLGLKSYHWAGLWQHTSTHRFQSFAMFASACLVAIFALLAELNSFYLKAVLWVPQDHWLVISRSFLFSFSGSCAVREVYDYLSSESHCRHVGSFVWLVLSSLLCEMFIILKFGWHVLSLPLHTSAYIAWGTGLSLFLLWTVRKFTPTAENRMKRQ